MIIHLKKCIDNKNILEYNRERSQVDYKIIKKRGYNMKIIVLNAKRVDFEDAQGKQITGVSVAYVENLDNHSSNNAMGVNIFKDFLPVAKWNKCDKVPAVYEGEFSYDADNRGRAMRKLIDITYANELIYEV